MTTPSTDSTAGYRQQRMFICAPKTDFADFWRETEEFIQKHPQILEAIRKDQDQLGLDKKEIRLKDQLFKNKNDTNSEQIEQKIEDIQADDLHLNQGRPRMSAWLVFMLMMARGYKGGVSTREFQDFIRDSMTVHAALSRREERLPARTTISENLNAVSNEVRLKIHEAQLEEIIDQGLDSFEEMTQDSTTVSSASEWPTDAVLIKKFIERAYREGNRLNERFGLEDFDRHWMNTWKEKMTRCVLKINTTSDGRTRNKQYRRLYGFARKAIQHLDAQRKEFERSVQPETFTPSRREKLEQVRDQIRQDLQNAEKKVETSEARVLEGESTGSKKKS